MFSLFRSLFQKVKPLVYRIPEGARVYAVGDVHGRADLLESMNQVIIAHAARFPTDENLVVYLGDYIDRGIHVREVLNLLQVGLPRNFKAVYLRGNHEDMMLRFLDNPQYLESWLAIGGQTTLMNYQVPVPGSGFSIRQALAVQDNLRQALPLEHRLFLHHLQTSFSVGNYFFVHAGVRPGIGLEQQAPYDLLWIRDGFLTSDVCYGSRIVHGHSIVRCPEVLPNRIGLDTGAYATGKLSCAVLENDQVHLLDATCEV